jgi:hypothetical protein
MADKAKGWREEIKVDNRVLVVSVGVYEAQKGEGTIQGVPIQRNSPLLLFCEATVLGRMRDRDTSQVEDE